MLGSMLWPVAVAVPLLYVACRSSRQPRALAPSGASPSPAVRRGPARSRVSVRSRPTRSDAIRAANFKWEITASRHFDYRRLRATARTACRSSGTASGHLNGSDGADTASGPARSGLAPAVLADRHRPHRRQRRDRHSYSGYDLSRPVSGRGNARRPPAAAPLPPRRRPTAPGRLRTRSTSPRTATQSRAQQMVIATATSSRI